MITLLEEEIKRVREQDKDQRANNRSSYKSEYVKSLVSVKNPTNIIRSAKNTKEWDEFHLQISDKTNITSVNAWFETVKDYMGTELVTSFYKKADMCHKTDITMEALKYKNDYVKHSAVNSLVKLKQYDLADFLFEEMISDF